MGGTSSSHPFYIHPRQETKKEHKLVRGGHGSASAAAGEREHPRQRNHRGCPPGVGVRHRKRGVRRREQPRVQLEEAKGENYLVRGKW